MVGNRAGHSRRGVALPLVLFCIVLILALGAALVKAVLLQHRHSQLMDQQHQSMWLAESAVQRALYKLRDSANYRGELWHISAATLGGSDDGSVTIQVESDVDDPTARKVTIEAIYPDHPLHRVVQRRELFVAGSAQQPSTDIVE